MLARFICKCWRAQRSGKMYLTSSIFQLPFKGGWLAASPRNVKHTDTPGSRRGCSLTSSKCQFASRLSPHCLTNAVCFCSVHFYHPRGWSSRIRYQSLLTRGGLCCPPLPKHTRRPGLAPPVSSEGTLTLPWQLHKARSLLPDVSSQPCCLPLWLLCQFSRV